MKKIILLSLNFLLLGCNNNIDNEQINTQEFITNNSNSGEVYTGDIYEKDVFEERKILYEGTKGALYVDEVINLDNNSIDGIYKKLLNFREKVLERKQQNYSDIMDDIDKEMEKLRMSNDRLWLNVVLDDLNSETLTKFKQTDIIKNTFDYNLVVEINTIQNEEILYDFVQYLNRNITIEQLKIDVTDKTVKISSQLFDELLGNSKYWYTLNLEFSKSLKEIDILNKLHAYKTHAYSFDKYYNVRQIPSGFKNEMSDRVLFTYEGNPAVFKIIDGKEIFEYYNQSGSEPVPFEYKNTGKREY